MTIPEVQKLKKCNPCILPDATASHTGSPPLNPTQHTPPWHLLGRRWEARARSQMRAETYGRTASPHTGLESVVSALAPCCDRGRVARPDGNTVRKRRVCAPVRPQMAVASSASTPSNRSGGGGPSPVSPTASSALLISARALISASASARSAPARPAAARTGLVHTLTAASQRAATAPGPAAG
eukprot:CAMPEP_0194344402 /NCGR_PEP_ID=MMETSP0171-20130528/101350_1 /TAXON_ID=218684 /ORGANISM="Corethron pennatum, Strain L29A3" /LENGTH=183 /DNA_ID=CAMNT_0039111057 /DNA_START=339 /DNA_END=890 /DNA_ORIENTATION=-